MPGLLPIYDFYLNNTFIAPSYFSTILCRRIVAMPFIQTRFRNVIKLWLSTIASSSTHLIFIFFVSQRHVCIWNYVHTAYDLWAAIWPPLIFDRVHLRSLNKCECMRLKTTTGIFLVAAIHQNTMCVPFHCVWSGAVGALYCLRCTDEIWLFIVLHVPCTSLFTLRKFNFVQITDHSSGYRWLIVSFRRWKN